MNHWPISVSESLGMSVNLIALLGLDTVCLPYETAGKVTGTIIRKEGEIYRAKLCKGECANGVLFIMLTISYLALLSDVHSGW